MSTEAPEPERIQLRGDGRRAQLLTVAATVALAAFAFTAGFPALWWAGTRLGLNPVHAATIPIVIDLGLVTFALVSAILRSRHRRATAETWSMIALTGLSVAVQVTHALTIDPAAWLPAAVGASLPLVVLFSSHSALRAVLADAPRRSLARKTRAAESAATVTKPATVRPVAALADAAAPRKPATVKQPVEPTMSLAEAVAEVRAGRLSVRGASAASGESRYAIGQARDQAA
ncbi:hypothetical protein [Microbacterium sp. A84]|uniref:hypothetical protein n=1 Tax=Microbacterium sp. A84 TaxID=3450715 RepID=UPI003F426AE6